MFCVGQLFEYVEIFNQHEKMCKNERACTKAPLKTTKMCDVTAIFEEEDDHHSEKILETNDFAFGGR